VCCSLTEDALLQLGTLSLASAVLCDIAGTGFTIQLIEPVYIAFSQYTSSELLNKLCTAQYSLGLLIWHAYIL
jgi:hypothetical protein